MKRLIGLSVLLLSGGLMSWVEVGAQPPSGGSPMVSPPRLQEPPLLRQRGSSGNEVPVFSAPKAETAMEGESGMGWSPPTSLHIREDRGIRYISGGIGANERAELNAHSEQFNLRLLFAIQTGNFLADVRVNITNARGETILSAKSDGPWFFAQLPPGTYTVSVDAMERTQRQSVHIGNSRQSRLNFYWR